MPKIVPVGPAKKWVGKTLWEIVGNLKNLGLGRIVKRNIYERYPEPTYFRILKIDTLTLAEDPKELRKVRAYVEQVFRGRKYEKIVEICDDSQIPDFRLVPKVEEKSLIEKAKTAALHIKKKTLPPTLPFPPLLQELIMQEKVAKGHSTDEEPRLKIVVVSDENVLYKVAKEGETPSVQFNTLMGKPLSPQLYEIPELYQIKLKL